MAARPGKRLGALMAAISAANNLDLVVIEGARWQALLRGARHCGSIVSVAFQNSECPGFCGRPMELL